MRALLLAAVLASVPWQGIAYHNHQWWTRIPLPQVGIILHRPVTIPICIHINWQARRMMRPEPGSLVA